MAKLGRAATKRRGRSPKVKVVSELESLFSSGDGFVFFDNKGLTLKEATDLRKRLRENKVAVKVAKNTLIKMALKNTGYDVESIESKLVGPTIVAVGLEDPISPAKGVMNYLKDNEGRIEVKAGIVGKDVLDANGVVALSKLPGRDELIAKLMGSMMAPAQNTVYALNACVSQMAWALAAYQRKLEGGGEEAA